MGAYLGFSTVASSGLFGLSAATAATCGGAIIIIAVIGGIWYYTRKTD
jgi:hypothetical protein